MMGVTQIKQLLPHRYPFLLVDRVVELKEGDYIRAYKNVSINEEIFNGHFPRAPIFPGVMIIEALAQASGILGFKTKGEMPQDNSVYLFAGADKVRFRRQVIPGDRLDLMAKMISEKRWLSSVFFI